jgi:hypothetical protein
MTKTKSPSPAMAPAPKTPAAARVTRAETMIEMMRNTDGATAAELGVAVGWQLHSVRGFIAGTLKKRLDLAVVAERKEGATRYRVVEAAEA